MVMEMLGPARSDLVRYGVPAGCDVAMTVLAVAAELAEVCGFLELQTFQQFPLSPQSLMPRGVVCGGGFIAR